MTTCPPGSRARKPSCRLVDVCETGERIRWLATGCSLRRGAGDRLSDLDLALGVRDDDFEVALPDVRALVDELADPRRELSPLAPRRTDRHERIIAQYADRCQLDLVVFPASVQIGTGRSIVRAV